MELRILRCLLAAALLLSPIAPVEAGRRFGRRFQTSGHGPVCSTCGASCGAAPQCGPSYVEKTIHVPQWTTETRTVTCTQYRTEEREQRYTVHRCVPETHQREKEYTVMVPHQRSKTVEYTVHKPVWETVTRQYQKKVPVWHTVEHQYDVQVPVWREVEKTYTVMVPHKEKRVGKRMVCKVVPTTQTRTVHRDRGHWETREHEVSCGYASGCYSGSCGYAGGCGYSDCGGCETGVACAPQTRTVTRKVWVPNVVAEEVEVTCHKKVWEPQEYEYYVTVCRPEERTATHKVCEYKTETRTGTKRVCEWETKSYEKSHKVCRYVPETRTREVSYCEMVPETRVKTYNVTTYKRVAEERVRTYHVRVPYQVEKEVQVRVCHRVPKTVTVPVCGPCHASQGACSTGHCN